MVIHPPSETVLLVQSSSMYIAPVGFGSSTYSYSTNLYSPELADGKLAAKITGSFSSGEIEGVNSSKYSVSLPQAS